MTTHAAATLAYDGSGIDGSLFTGVTGFARHTPWLNGAIDLWTNAGLAVFAVLMVIGWWNARRDGARAMTLALAVPVSVAATFAVAEVVKKLVAEVRPCRSLPHDFFIEACPARSDYAFPQRPQHHGVRRGRRAVAARSPPERRRRRLRAARRVHPGLRRRALPARRGRFRPALAAARVRRQPPARPDGHAAGGPVARRCAAAAALVRRPGRLLRLLTDRDGAAFVGRPGGRAGCQEPSGRA